jgi:hypothetical protein
MRHHEPGPLTPPVGPGSFGASRPPKVGENGRSKADRGGDRGGHLPQFAQRVWALGDQDHPV